MKKNFCKDIKVNGLKCEKMQGIQYQLITNKLIKISGGCPIVFNTKILNNSAITYNDKNGEFTLPEKGLYIVDWSISTSGAKGLKYVSFGLEAIGGMITEETIKTPLCEIGGHVLVNVSTSSLNLRLINTTGKEVVINDTCVQANITIVHVSNST